MFKRVRLLFIPFVSVVLAQGTFAMAPGFYIGASLGPSSNNASEKTAYTINYQELCPATGPCPTLPTFPPSFSTLTAKPKVSMFGSRVMVGYQFNDYAALEGGLDYFSNIRYTTGTSNVCSPVRAPASTSTLTFVPNDDPCSPTSATTAGVRGVDFVLKASLPFNAFDIYGKVGPVYLVTDIKGAFSPPVINPVPGQPIPKGAGNQTNTYFKPIFSIGADYTISQNWVADLAWTHLSVGQGISSVDFYSIGVAYHFTSKFCGQFLCDD